MSQVCRDERTIAQLHRYGFEVAAILYVVLTLDLFWKTVIDPRPVTEFLDLFLIVIGMYFYTTIRLGWGGLLWPSRDSRRRFQVVGGLAATLSYMAVFVWITGPSNLLNAQGLLRILVSGLAFGVTWFVFTALMARLTRRRLEKELEEDPD